MPSNRRDVFETIRDKRQWHSPPDAEAAKLGFRGWHSRGYLPHFDMPGLVQFINYRLDDAMPTSLRHEWSALLEIDDELKRRTKIEDWDLYIRDEAHYRKVVHYIEMNPMHARLVRTPQEWPFSSARFRDEYNRLP